ncbi:MAG: tRNA lysidine(34) synthetase TilS [Acidobacteriota bacterium]|nr:tRNA lysidine(34) synthetase TilS [Acidobacteriota bacterium]
MTSERDLLDACRFPSPGTPVDLAVSGGPDSLGLALLARAAGLPVTLHHVNHHARPASGEDAAFVAELAREWGVGVVVHDVHVEPGANFEARARAARRAVLPFGTLTGHTLDDLAETVLLNLLRGAGLDGLSPMVGDPTKPLLEVRRRDLADYVAAGGYAARHDETNLDGRYRRNRVRHEVLPLLDEVAERDVALLLSRAAQLIYDERSWIAEATAADEELGLGGADCRELATWPTARLRRWLRVRLAREDPDGVHPPESAEVERALAVVRGEAVATELAGGRRLGRRRQHLFLE